MKEATTNQRWVFIVGGILFLIVGITSFFFDSIGSGIVFLLFGLLALIFAKYLNKNRTKIQARHIIDNSKGYSKETLNMIKSEYFKKKLQFDKKKVESISVLHEKITADDIYFVIVKRSIEHETTAGEQYAVGDETELGYSTPKSFKELSDQSIERIVPSSVKTLKCSIIDVPCKKCNGLGRCNECHGSGHVVCPKCDGKRRIERYRDGNKIYEKCPRCGGTGRVQCKKCEGSGNCTDCEGSGRNLCQRCEGTGIYQEYDVAVDEYIEKIKTIYNSNLERELLDKLDVASIGDPEKVYSINTGFAKNGVLAEKEEVRRTIESIVKTTENIVMVGVSGKECVMHLLKYTYNGIAQQIVFSENEIISSTI